MCCTFAALSSFYKHHVENGDSFMSPRICVCPFLSLGCVDSTSRLNVLAQRLYLYCEDCVTLVQSFALWPVRPLGSNLALESLMPWGTASHLEWLPAKLLTLFPFLVQISMPVLYSSDQNSWGQKIRWYTSIFKKFGDTRFSLPHQVNVCINTHRFVLFSKSFHLLKYCSL